ncbi:hypothetical protein L228DRAFT_120248 [Xylona heveae TC161]|uniref:Uncharacterized protein n=1 Tax=Xylona heveae (strain CBS 132557 / TC161) TaxID=1328760 RepID=A0A165HJ29_XYLHT|nr:hypothetical protein L228DRAFT_120248 [Xylona heveae TC161]KZF23593.1 hypothetical protein L228DRAFT_120248 [Xylona heveae TC161]
MGTCFPPFSTSDFMFYIFSFSSPFAARFVFVGNVCQYNAGKGSSVVDKIISCVLYLSIVVKVHKVYVSVSSPNGRVSVLTIVPPKDEGLTATQYCWPLAVPVRKSSKLRRGGELRLSM